MKRFKYLGLFLCLLLIGAGFGYSGSMSKWLPLFDSGSSGQVVRLPLTSDLVDYKSGDAYLSGGTVTRASGASFVDPDGVLQIADGDETPFSHSSVDDETGATLIYGSFADGQTWLYDDAGILAAFVGTGNLVIGADSGGNKLYGFIGAAEGGEAKSALPNNITGITKANPGVVSSVAHTLVVGNLVYFSGLTEMTELNGKYKVVTAVGSADVFSINDTSGYGAAETTGGACGEEVTTANANAVTIFKEYSLSTEGYNALDSGLDFNDIATFDVYQNLMTAAGSTAEARFETLGLLSEGEGTNWCLQSNAFDTWTSSGITEAQDVTGPDGVANSAWTVTDPGGAASSHIRITGTLGSVSGTYSYQVFVKEGTTSAFTLRVRDSDVPADRGEVDFQWTAGVLSVKAEDTGTGAVEQLGSTDWWRAIISCPSVVAGNLHTVYLYPTENGVDPGSSVTTIFYGAQLEATPYATSYIPTTTIPVTRTADSHSWTMSTAFKNLMGDTADSPFTMVVEWTPKFDYGDMTTAWRSIIGVNTTPGFYHRNNGELWVFDNTNSSSIDPNYSANTTYTFALRVYDSGGMKFEVGEKHGGSWTWDGTPANYDGSFNPSTDLIIGYNNEYPFNISNIYFYSEAKSKTWIEAHF